MAQNRNAPAYQEYAAAMLVNINYRLMTIAERGLLYSIRLECWENKLVPVSPDRLAKYIGCDVVEVKAALTENVKSFLSEKDGSFACPELDNYRQHLEDRKSKQSAGGKHGATISNRNIKKAARQGATYFSDETGNPQVPRRGSDGSLVKSSTVKPSQVRSLEIGVIDDSFVKDIIDYEEASNGI